MPVVVYLCLYLCLDYGTDKTDDMGSNARCPPILVDEISAIEDAAAKSMPMLVACSACDYTYELTGHCSQGLVDPQLEIPFVCILKQNSRCDRCRSRDHLVIL